MFFKNFPKIYYSLKSQYDKNPVIVTNLLLRAAVQQAVQDNTLIYYTYNVKESDTPEIIAKKYYGDPNRHWIVLMVNNIVNPYYDWPLPYDAFQKHITDKYGSIAAAQATIDHYNKVVSKVESNTGTITINRYEIDANTYAEMPSQTTQTYNLTDGSSVLITTTKEAVDCYTNEVNENENKRNIKILDKIYVNQVETEIKALFN